MKKILFLLLIINCTSLLTYCQIWVRKYNGPGANRIEIATSIAVDNAGYIYVTGQSQFYGTNYDYITIKYNSNGDSLWTRRYDGPAGGTVDNGDYASAITVDAQGNVYVTGFSAGIGTYQDFATIKYNASGTELWVRRYNGPGNTNDAGRSIAVDDSGNVYVTGESYGSGTNYDFATIKYNSGGVQQWAMRYNGTGNYVDQPSSLAVDSQGNVYVTGYTISGLSNYATVKYNLNGVQQWAAIYNGTGNGSDEAKSVKVDNAGSVYVTGRSFQSGTTYDYTTIKYNASTGDSIWVVRYNGPANGSDEASSLALDRFGNVYVTGNSTGLQQDVATVKYNSGGIQQWARRYETSAMDYGLSVAVDSSLNVYVAGFRGTTHTEDYLTLKYDSGGVQQWANIYNGPGGDRDEARGVAVDNQGNVYVTGFSYAGILSGLSDYATIKYNSSGIQQWVQRFNGPVRSSDFLTAIAKDNQGNIYVTGRSEGGGAGYDFVTIKYNSSGDSLWVRRFNGPSNSNDQPTAIFVDNSGNVYVTGNTWATGEFQSAEFLTIKYNSSGALQWYDIYPGGGYASSATSIAADANGNVYVTGNYRWSLTPFLVDYVTIKYNQNGDTLWTRRYDGGGGARLDEAKKIAVDAAGYVYVTGRSVAGTGGLDFLTIKYNPSGDSLWTARFNGPGNDWDEPNDMILDASGNVYLTGFSRMSALSGSEDYVTLKYNSSGVLQWSRLFNGSGNGYDVSKAITLDTLNNIFITGVSWGAGGNYNYATIKYNSSGDSLWSRVYNSPSNSTDIASSVKTDRSLNVFVAGGIRTGSSYNFGIVKYDASGSQLSTFQYPASSDSIFVNPQLEIDADGNVYAAGSTFENTTDYDIVLIKLLEPIGIKPISNEIPKRFNLYQNYPNPFNSKSKIRFDITSNRTLSGAKGLLVKLVIYDIRGREVKTLVNEQLNPGTYEAEWDGTNFSSGVYFYKLITKEYVKTNKMVLVK